MSLSSKKLGEKIGLNAQEMNVLLKEEGFQDGEPGDYSVTDKGAQYVTPKGNDNGYGGYAHRGWNWNEWDESIIDELDTSEARIQEIRDLASEQRKERRLQRKIESEKYWKSLQDTDSEEQNTENNRTLITIILLGLSALFTYCGLKIYKLYKNRKKKKDNKKSN